LILELKEFIVAAKTNSYATKGESEGRILEDGAKEFVYLEGEFKYRDRYYGYNPFIGEEIVWHRNRVVWAMNFCGKVVSEALPVDEVYNFLRKALRSVTVREPFRGPIKLVESDLEYSNVSSGDIDCFYGLELITLKGHSIYKLRYHGGVIS